MDDPAGVWEVRPHGETEEAEVRGETWSPVMVVIITHNHDQKSVCLQFVHSHQSISTRGYDPIMNHFIRKNGFGGKTRKNLHLVQTLFRLSLWFILIISCFYGLILITSTLHIFSETQHQKTHKLSIYSCFLFKLKQKMKA